MNIVTYATPFFLLAIVLELGWGILKKNNTYRVNDSVNSLNLGMMSTLYKLITLNIGGLVFAKIEQDFALFNVDLNSISHWILAILLYDFCYYWFHRISHERQIFWAAHVVHHQSEDYNLSTALRQTSTSFAITWVFYIPCFLLGMPAYMYVTIASGHLVYQFWIHTRHIPKLGFLEWFMVTPSNHRVHHAQNAQYIDKNYGGLFIIWDRLFGTFAEEDEEEEVIYGLRTPLLSWNPIWANIHIYVSMVKDAWRTENLRDKFGMIWSRTGWRPADVAEKFPVEKTNLDDFHKYNPALSDWERVTIVIQYLLLIAYFSWFTVNLANLSYAAQSLNILIMTLTAVALGAVSGQKMYAPLVEFVRFCSIITAITMTIKNDSPLQWTILGVGYLVASSAVMYVSLQHLPKKSDEAPKAQE